MFGVFGQMFSSLKSVHAPPAYIRFPSSSSVIFRIICARCRGDVACTHAGYFEGRWGIFHFVLSHCTRFSALRWWLLHSDVCCSSLVADEVREHRFALPYELQQKQVALFSDQRARFPVLSTDMGCSPQNIFAVFSFACYVTVWYFMGWRSALFALWSLSVKASRFDVVGWGQVSGIPLPLFF